LQINQTFALLSLTLPITANNSTMVIGYMSVIAGADIFDMVFEAREGLELTGVALLYGPATLFNLFPPGLTSDGDTPGNVTACATTDVNYVFPPASPAGQVDRHPIMKPDVVPPPFPMEAYPAILQAYTVVNPNINNASSDLKTTNEHGESVAVGWARPESDLADWLLIVEQTHSEAFSPVTEFQSILLGCVFGSIGFIMLIVLPLAHFSVLPIARLREATLTSVAPPGCSEADDSSTKSGHADDETADEEIGRPSTGKSSRSAPGFFVRMQRLGRGRQRRYMKGESKHARQRVFKIPAKVQDKKHWITDELTELTGTFNEMSDELTTQYARLEERVAQRTRELDLSKKAAEAANESKTLFIANISHELKTPLNGILGMCAVCMGEDDLPSIKKSLQVVYKSGDLLLHLLNDLLTFSKNQIGQSISLEEKEFGLSDIRSQIVTIFDKQVKERRINFGVIYLGTDFSDSLAIDHSDEEEQKGTLFFDRVADADKVRLPAIGPAGTGRLKNMRLWGDQHRILQVIINLVSNSLKFTPENGKVEVRIKCLGEVENVANERSSRSGSVASKQGSQRLSKTRERLGSVSNSSITATPPRSGLSTKIPPKGTALLINPNEPKAALTNMVRERAATPPPPNARTLLFQFEVEDTGPGMSPALQERVFEPFVQGDLGLSKKYGGTGLGLSICSQLATLMGGSITLQSTVGVGSTFNMQIPLKFVKERPSSTNSSIHSTSRPASISVTTDGASTTPNRSSEPSSGTCLSRSPSSPETQPRLVGLSQPFFAPSHKPAKRAKVGPTISSAGDGPTVATPPPQDAISSLKLVSRTKQSRPSTSGGQKLRVLVAEDNLVNQEVVLRMLKLESIYDVTLAADGLAAYEAVKSSMKSEQPGFNVIFMDIQMPNLDGLESTRLIRELGYSRPIVALTAFAEESNVKECLGAGMDMFLAKPIRRPALKQVLSKFSAIEEETDEPTSAMKVRWDAAAPTPNGHADAKTNGLKDEAVSPSTRPEDASTKANGDAAGGRPTYFEQKPSG
jgi:osomolarity two-component system sensor histidine kinase SLN1